MKLSSPDLNLESPIFPPGREYRMGWLGLYETKDSIKKNLEWEKHIKNYEKINELKEIQQT